MTIFYECGSETTEISDDELKKALYSALEKIGLKKKVMIIPPDFTRYHSKSGILTENAYDYYKTSVSDIMPALGTHSPMTATQIEKMFGKIPKDLFRVHDWRNDVVTIGHVPRELVNKASDGKLNEPWPAQLNKIVWNEGHDLILSIGQVVPHEVMGMSNHNKNLFIGIGGSQAINFSHFIGAIYGMERMMGRADNPLRKILNYASDNFTSHLPIVYVQTVIGRRFDGKLVTRGIFIGDDDACFKKAAELSIRVNFTLFEEPLNKIVVYLDPEEYQSTWLGNKSIYRTRMALADDAELIVIAPGVKEFGEDAKIDELIRKFGYRTTPEVLNHLKSSRDLMKNLSAAAHLIHGSSEERFSITYCPGGLTKQEIEGVGYKYGDCDAMSRQYNPKELKDGWNDLPGGEKVYFISNPATGLWAYRGRFEDLNSRKDDPKTEMANPEITLFSTESKEKCLDAGIGGGISERKEYAPTKKRLKKY